MEFVDLVDLDLRKFQLSGHPQGASQRLVAGGRRAWILYDTISNHEIPKELWNHRMDVAQAVITLPLENKGLYESHLMPYTYLFLT